MTLGSPTPFPLLVYCVHIRKIYTTLKKKWIPWIQHFWKQITCVEVGSLLQTLKSLYDELERTNRGQNKYLELVTKEHHVLQEQSVLTEKLNVAEREEREAFSKLSRAVRDSHESERAQAEKTKYWWETTCNYCNSTLTKGEKSATTVL